MHYHVSRGLREIIAPRQTMPKKKWEEIKSHFDGKCSYCGEESTQKNRGIVADHVIPATDYGEFVEGNVIPACQTCNDSRGNKDWLVFIRSKPSAELQNRIEKIKEYLQNNPYTAPTPESVLTVDELKAYNELQKQWHTINIKAKALYEAKHKK